MKTKKTSSFYILLVIGVLILINILSEQFFFRLDLTQDGIYTLSKATKNILKDLEEPVTVKAYFTKKDLPPQYLKIREDFKNLLIEFNAASGGNVVYEFIDPNEKTEKEQEAMQAGIQPVLIQVREKDQMKQLKAYLGAVLQYGDETEVIPFMKEGEAMEYALASGIKKISLVNKPEIALIQGHGEATLAEMQQANFALGILYKVREVELSDTTQLDHYKAVAIVAPKDSFPVGQLRVLDNYLSKGGHLFLAMNRVDADFQTLQGTEITTGLESWLANKGLNVDKNFVIDVNCATISVTQQSGMFRYNRPMKFFYLPILNTFHEHPITKGLEQVVLKFASTLSYSGDTAVKFTPLLQSSSKSSTLSAPLTLDIRKNWTEADFPMSNLTLGGVLEGPIVGDVYSKLVVYSDGDFAVNGEGQGAQQQQPDNINLFVNTIDWLSDDTGLIDLRTKGITSRPLDELEDSTKQLLKWLNFLLPILLIIIYGFVRMQRNKSLRMRRMEKGYVK